MPSINLALAEGFDHWGEGQQGIKGWSGSSFQAKIPGRGFVGGEGVQVIVNNPLSKVLSPALTTFVVGAAIKLHLYQGVFMSLWGNGGSSLICTVGRNGTSQIRVTDAAARTIDGTIITHDDVWFYVEIKVVIGTSGTCEVHLNGAPEIASTVANFGTHGLDRIQFECDSLGDARTNVDDLYADNGTFLGDIIVRTLYPNGDGTYSQWTPDVAGPHYSRVNEHHMDGDGSYVYDSTVGHIDSYDMDDLPGVTVYAAQLNLAARKGDAGLRQIAPMMRQSSTDYVGPTSTLSLDYNCYSWILQQDPSGSDWTVATINADECGVKTIA